MPLKVLTKVSISSIHGLGLFAQENISKGQLIWSHDPIIDGWYENIPYDDVLTKHLDRYCCYDQEKAQWIKTCDNVCFINHSDNPNLTCPNKYVHYAERDINFGEELTIDYRLVCDKVDDLYMESLKSN